MKKNGYSAWEEIIVLIVIAIMVNVIYYRYKILEKKALKTQIKVELSNLKLAIELYKIRNNKYPSNLFELYKKGYVYYKNFYIDNSTEQILDKLGKRYIYNKKTGKVSINPETLKELQ
ncbi:type II secretion system protein GspG [Hippea maritima]|uniref:Type II secretion system protein GspG C-terminal domain-containing protein n=1 Tax=Hippea maritima (strain ATCC 700847 / DSM 10411 / MH2) TaxID=760142 RepID=F2LWI9_HIPMA|nr:type II secretion system protein GspG [Hippea maritima]AEA34098.1 hypothetical protein Hipma_1132 [Hippea maritima DSM 10411]